MIQQRGHRTCLEPLKIPGRYQANIIPSTSIIMHGAEAVTPSSVGWYRRLSPVSFSPDLFVPEFKGFFGSLSA